MKTLSRFIHLQNTQLTDENNQILTDDVLLKDGTILRFDSYGYLDGEIEYADTIECYRHGKLHGCPAVINLQEGIEEDWEYGQMISFRKINKEKE